MDPKILLYDSYDRELSEAEQKMLDNALLSSASLQKERKDLDKLHKLLSDQKADIHPSVADGVMAEIANPVVPIERNLRHWFPTVAAACLLVIMSMLLQVYLDSGTINTEVIMGLDQLNVEDAYTYIYAQ